MSIFGKIRDAIFGTAHAAPPPTIDTTQAPGTPAPHPATAPGAPPASAGATAASSGSASAPVIDIENHLDAMPGADHLNWRTSIVDLMKLLGIDSDYESRKALAEELGRTDYSGDAEDNVWLHSQVMAGLKSHGGHVPAQFVD